MAIAMILLTYIATSQSKEAIREAKSEAMEQSVTASVNAVEGKLDVIKNTAVNLTEMIATSYKFVQMDNYAATITGIITENDSVLGAGVWFEPNVFDAKETYIGPYWYKEGANVVETWDYSNAEYDYLNQEYYINAKSLSRGQAKITDPYYDPTSGLVMSTCSAPIYDNGTYIGCVTVDMQLSNIQDMVKSIKIGKTGTAMLAESDGTYIYTQDDAKVQNEVKITEDDNASLASVGSTVVASNSNSVSEVYFNEGKDTIMLLYTTIPDVNWKAMIRMSTTEMDETVTSLTRLHVRLCVAALLVGAVII
jgi:methyl-accepting chemotaxis protein